MNSKYELMLSFLSSQVLIEKARLKRQKAYSMNVDMIIESEITQSVIDEIERQIEMTLDAIAKEE